MSGVVGLPLVIRGMRGLGDNIFQRPFVRAACERHPRVYLETPWPELYEDLARVRPVRTNTTLRTQRKNEQRTAAAWYAAPPTAKRARFAYGAELGRKGILEALGRCVPLNPGDVLALDLPASLPRRVPSFASPYVVVRPATVRREWSNPWRNPRPEYLVEAAAKARAAGLRVIVVADLQEGEEEIVGALPPHDMAILDGRLSVRELLGLVEGAAGVIGGVGWIVPACLAMRKPGLIVCGGNGAHNAPHVIADGRLEGARLTFAIPDRFCMCKGASERREHKCDKLISDLATPIASFLAMATSSLTL